MPSLRRDAAAPWRHLDGILVAAAISVALLGCLMVFSATRFGLEQQGLDPFTSLKRQALFVVVGLVVMAAVAAVDYRRLHDLAPVLYLGSVGLLVLVISPLGTEVKGSQSWFAFGSFQLQPAELAKLGSIIALAAYCADHRGDLDGRRLFTALGIAAVPMALIMLQPDLGSTLVFVAVVMGMLLVAGARPRHIAALTLVGTIGLIGVLRMDLLETYQKDRLTAFATGGSTDRQGAAFQLAQAKTTVAAGGLAGSGIFAGTQTKLGFVPEQQTDFIFTVVGEELGFLGSATLLLLYGVIVWRLWRTGLLARDGFGMLVCVGVLAMLVFHVFQNMGMSMGIMPITGIPLPLMSYGGSATITIFAALGLALNVHMRRFT
ncbi:MAG: rod shape-determining protein RodA [Acidimicrobiales bacterium]